MSDEHTPFPQTLSGHILLSTDTFDWDTFRLQFFDDWQTEVTGEPVEDNLIFQLGEITVTLSLIRKTVPEAIETAENNYLWINAAEAVRKHSAHVALGIIGADNPLQRHILFTMTAASAMRQENVIGLYQYPVTRKASDYIDAAMSLKQDNFPVTIWVFAGFYKGELGKICCYTYGLEQFGKEEVEILNSDADMVMIYQFIYQIVGYLIAQNGTLNDGEAIGFSRERSYEATRSPGVAIQGTTVKISF